MGCRGIWNLHINEKWYRLCHQRGRISPPDSESTFQTIKQLCDEPGVHLGKWELVPFPSPIHSNLDYVYTVDQDSGVLVISLWQELNGSLRPAAIRIDLARLCESSRLLIKHSIERPEYIIGDTICQDGPTPDGSRAFGSLDIDLGIPTPINELQERFFTDFVFVWRFYIDDPLTWRYTSAVFRVLCIAFLRLAAWDFELSPDSPAANVGLPISFASIPSWNYPETDIYRFHSFLIVLQEDVESKAMINKAIKSAKAYIGDYHGNREIRLIFISPQHVKFVDVSHDAILTSKSMALLTNQSAVQCSPGFRALTRILTSDYWKKSLVDKERWKFNIPPEILEMRWHFRRHPSLPASATTPRYPRLKIPLF